MKVAEHLSASRICMANRGTRKSDAAPWYNGRLSNVQLSVIITNSSIVVFVFKDEMITRCQLYLLQLWTFGENVKQMQNLRLWKVHSWTFICATGSIKRKSIVGTLHSLNYYTLPGLQMWRASHSFFILSTFRGLAYSPIVETSFPELVVSFLDFSPWISLGTFLILLIDISLLTEYSCWCLCTYT